MIDFAAIAQHALGAAPTLLAEWLPAGERRGEEYVALNPTRTDRHLGSFTINVRTGIWRDFATDDGGADLIGLHAYLNRTSNGEAAHALVARLSLDRSLLGERASTVAPPSATRQPSAAPEPSGRWLPIVPVPPDAPTPPAAHWRYGRPSAQWRYLDAEGRLVGFVCRFDPKGERKQIAPLVFARHSVTGETAWKWTAIPAPRPLFGLPALSTVSDRNVLIVEGERCAEAAQAELGDAFTVVTWSGGVNAIDKTDWTPLAKRHVLLWPDADAQRDRHGELLPHHAQPGVLGMERVAKRLATLGCSIDHVAIPAPDEKPAGWDVADAIGEGLRGEALLGWIRERTRRWIPTSDSVANPPPAADDSDEWKARLTYRGERIESSLHNVSLILQHDPAWQGVLAYDLFRDVVTKRRRPPYADATSGDWHDIDDTRATVWLESYGLRPFSSRVVAEAVEMVARRNAFHPVREYLDSLDWDEKPRIDTWAIDLLGVADTPYARLIGRYFLMGMVARVSEPGCQFDYMLVLEGEQGTGKTSALQILGGEWFSNTDLSLHDKDSLLGLQAIWLHEFAELDALAKAEATRQKSFLSRRVDDFRPPYGRRVIKRPRQCVFAGSTNVVEYNRDATGGRRFWSLATSRIDLEGLRVARDQLFAEAVCCYQAGDRYHPTREEQELLFTPEQVERQQVEPFEEMIAGWVREQTSDEFTMAQVLDKALHVPAAQMQASITTRVGIVLKRLGCSRIECRTATDRRRYRRPETLRSNPVTRSDGAPEEPADVPM